MRAGLLCLVFTLLLACGARAEAGDRGGHVPPADTIGWWIDAAAAPAAFVDTTLQGMLDLPGLRSLHYPDGRGGFQATPYDTQPTSIGSAQYDIAQGTTTMRLPNARLSRMRLSYADVFEMHAYDRAKESDEDEFQDAAITLVARGRKPDSLRRNADVAVHLIVTNVRNPKHPMIRSLHPLLTPAGNPGDTISIPWRARPGDRVEVRVAVDASGHDLAFHDGGISVGTQLLFEGLLNGVTVRPVRVTPPHSPEPPLKSLYR